MTPNSGADPYVTPLEFALRHDARSVAQYASDDANDPLKSAPIPTILAALQDPTTPQGANLAAALADASGMLESAALRSGRYTAASLAALAASGNSGAYLKKTVSSLAMYGLIARRPGPAPPETAIHAYTEAVAALNDLSSGVRIFAFSETEGAGLPQTKQFTPNDYAQNNLITNRWPSMWGARQAARRNGGGSQMR